MRSVIFLLFSLIFFFFSTGVSGGVCSPFSPSSSKALLFPFSYSSSFRSLIIRGRAEKEICKCSIGFSPLFTQEGAKGFSSRGEKCRKRRRRVFSAYLLPLAIIYYSCAAEEAAQSLFELSCPPLPSSCPPSFAYSLLFFWSLYKYD